MDKESIKKELVEFSNSLLTKYSEPDFVDSVSVMNMASKTVFLGSIKVYDENNLKNIKKELEDGIKKYGKLSIRQEKVFPCCAPNYFHISYNISIEN